MTDEPSDGRRRRLARVALIALLLPVAGVAVLWLSLPDPARWARATRHHHRPHRAAARRGARGRPALPARRSRWVPLERISQRLVDAVVASEDATFFDHHGFDWDALGSAFRHNLSRRRYARGASTITQQLAKNLYLGTEKSLLRKAREALLTVEAGAAPRQAAHPGALPQRGRVGRRRLRRRGRRPAPLRDRRRRRSPRRRPCCWRRCSRRPGGPRSRRRPRVAGGARPRAARPAPAREQVIPPGEHAGARAELERYLRRRPRAGAGRGGGRAAARRSAARAPGEAAGSGAPSEAPPGATRRRHPQGRRRPAGGRSQRPPLPPCTAATPSRPTPAEPADADRQTPAAYRHLRPRTTRASP